jgi:hypothetical protein
MHAAAFLPLRTKQAIAPPDASDPLPKRGGACQNECLSIKSLAGDRAMTQLRAQIRQPNGTANHVRSPGAVEARA